MKIREYVVSVKVSFITPLSVSASGEADAEKKGIAQFKERFKDFKKNLDDIADYEVELDYVEDAE